MFQPGDGFGIQMIGRFIQEQNVRFLQKQAAQRDAAFFTAGEHLHECVAGRAAKGIHRHFQAGIDVPGIQGIEFFLHGALSFAKFGHLVIGHRFGKFFVDVVVFLNQIHRTLHALFHNLPHGFIVVQMRFLLQITHRVAG